MIDTLALLQRTTDTRLRDAAEALLRGTYQITIEVQTADLIGATIHTPEHEYVATLGQGGFTSCTCPDASYRKNVCKHILIVALYSRCLTPQQTAPPPRRLPPLPYEDMPR